jgi:hypothetical protein
MTTVDSLDLTIIAIALAILVDRLVAHFCRRISEDRMRLESAADSIVAQRRSIDDLFARKSVPHCILEFVIDTADASMTRKGAHILFEIISGKRSVTLPEKAAQKYAEVAEAVKDLMVNDPDAYEIYRTYIFRVPVTTILQWPETFKAMANLSLRLASEKEPAAARDVAAMRSEVNSSFGGLAAT